MDKIKILKLLEKRREIDKKIDNVLNTGAYPINDMTKKSWGYDKENDEYVVKWGVSPAKNGFTNGCELHEDPWETDDFHMFVSEEFKEVLIFDKAKRHVNS